MRRIVVTLPAHNEEKTIGAVLQGVFAVVAALPDFDWRVVVVDDCSTDQTRRIAAQAGAQVIALPAKSGLAEVFRQEMRAALALDADWIVHLDSDGQHPPAAIPHLLLGLEQGNDLVIGSRFLDYSPAGKPRIEQFESRSFSRLLSWLTGHTLTDVHSGFRAFTRAVAEQIPIRSQFSYAREQLFRAACRGYRLKDVPILAATRQHGHSRLIKNRYQLMLAVTWRLCVWSVQERRSRLKMPVTLAWGVGIVALSWVWRALNGYHPNPKDLSVKPSIGLATLTNKLNVPPASHRHWQHARVWDRWHEEDRPRVGEFYQTQRQKVTGEIARMAGPLTVLELCCGTGRLAHDLLALEQVSRLVVTDISPQALATLNRRLAGHPRFAALDAVAANVLELADSLPAQTFDVIICIDALPNLPWPALPLFFQQIARLLKPTGRFVGNYLASETIDAHTTRKHGRLGYARIYSRLLWGKLLSRMWPSLAGQQGLLRTGTAYQADLLAVLQPAFTVEQLESDVYHWFVAVPRERPQ